ncbi:MAG: polysaccharide deacetylase family protein, partial [Verrucomicrobiota bacterium]|nr:polysaccharide deacetylase family protein [Verrucomicrobiota bacterium]
MVLLILVAFVAGVLFVQALLVRPELRLPPALRQLKGQLKALQSQRTQLPAEQIWRKFFAVAAASPSPAKAAAPPRPRSKKTFTEIRLGFSQGWDTNSAASLEEHARDLTHLCPEWMSLVDGDGTLKIEEDPAAARIAASHGLVLMPQLNNLLDDNWQPEAVENVANGPPEKRAKFILNLLNHLQEIKAGGVVIDWEQVDPAYETQLTALLTKIAEALHAVDKELWLVVPMGEELKAYDLAALAPAVDHFVALLFDENGEEDQPGPVASQDWFEGWLEVIKGYGEPGQWIGAIGTQGYDWTSGKKRAEVISFADAMSRASYAGIEKVEINAPSYNPAYSYQEPLGDHSVWFLDAITFCNQLNAIRAAGLGGIAISRLGSEDPQIWNVLRWKNAAAPAVSSLRSLEKMTGDDTVTNVGQGEIVTVDDSKDDGVRTIVSNADGRLSATYTDFPTYPILYHQGAGDEHEVALTFDDGPDPKWTPQVLDILKERKIHAAFFLLGNQAEQYPGLVERIVAEGHEIGNHTYTHPNLAEISPQQTRLELNATQRLIESLTGRSTTLFRPPYNADSRPSKVEELTPLKLVQDELGYLIVLENIDPEDWARPGADVILDRVKQLRHTGYI